MQRFVYEITAGGNNPVLAAYAVWRYRLRLHQIVRSRVFLSLTLALTALLPLLSLAPQTAPALGAGACAIDRSPASPDSQEQAMLLEINNYRTQNGLSPLAPSLALNRSAIWKSTDMAANHYFSHDDLIRSWSQRISDCGYSSSFAGENIAEGNADAASTFVQWRNSPPHNANMLDADYHAIGIGRAESANGDWYWTTDFGDVVDSTASPAAAPLIAPIPSPPNLIVPAPAPATEANLLVPPPAPAAPVHPGMTARVNTPGDCLRAHSAPVLASPVATCLANGTTVVVLSGPVSGDGQLWWQVFGFGWVAGAYLLPGP